MINSKTSRIFYRFRDIAMQTTKFIEFGTQKKLQTLGHTKVKTACSFFSTLLAKRPKNDPWFYTLKGAHSLTHDTYPINYDLYIAGIHKPAVAFFACCWQRESYFLLTSKHRATE